ncbi:MAG: EamA family transporter [Clostridia bacterium]|nr:EamA family transporter [Clostridia bacterium]
MKDVLIILSCVPLYLLNAFCDKCVSAKGRSGLLYNTLKFLIGALCFLPLMIWEGAPPFAAGAICCGAACGLMYAVGKTAILRGFAETSVAFMVLCHAAGMLIPCICGYCFWNERLTLLSLAGILLTVLSIYLIKSAGGNGAGVSARGILLGAAVFLGSGGVMICQKLMGVFFPAESVSAYNFYSFLLPAILLGGLSALRERKGVCGIRPLLPFALGSALSLCVISFVMTKLAARVPSVLLFPLFNGLGILLVCLGSAALFKEKMTVKETVGVCIGIVGMWLVNF